MAVLARIEANVLATAARGRDVVDVGPFRAFLAPDDPAHLLSVAVPTSRGADWAKHIPALDAAFAALGRRPRLEFLCDLHPDLGAALEAAGYTRSMSAAVMVADPSSYRAPPRTPGAACERLTDADERALRGLLAVQAQAYGEPIEGGTDWRPMLLRGLRDGSIAVCAVWVDGAVVSGASLLVGGGAAELAGVATLPDRRRRGLASSACGCLLEDYFTAGHDLCWLSAAEGAEALYARLGFRRTGEQHNYER